MQNLEAFQNFIRSPRKIIITTHIKPDADALGSSLGLANFLLSLGHHVQVITPSDYPSFLSWMHGNDQVLVFNQDTKKQAEDLVRQADAIFCLDFSSLKRIEELGEMVSNAEGIKILIDHHLEPESFATYSLWDVNASATAELVYDFIEMLGELEKITPEIAECLYAGILTDTGGFKHSNTSAKTHRIVANLMEKGANISKVSKLIYDNNSLNRLKLIGFALAERLTVLDDLHVAYFILSKSDLSRFSYQTGDSEGLVNYALSINGIRMAAIIIERDEAVRLSFRSFGDVSVNDIAKEYFNGGGHKNAAGGTSEESLEKTVEKFLSVVNQHKIKFNHKQII